MAGALLESGFVISVWNRTPAKCARLLGLGAEQAHCVADAARCADLLIVCVAEQLATVESVMTEEVARELHGRRSCSLRP